MKIDLKLPQKMLTLFSSYDHNIVNQSGIRRQQPLVLARPSQQSSRTRSSKVTTCTIDADYQDIILIFV